MPESAPASTGSDAVRSKTSMPSQTLGEFDARRECDSVIASIEEKADKNKKRARWSASCLTGLTASIPFCLIVAEGFAPESFGAFVSGRVVPGALAAGAAVLARWIQIEQPHQRWTLYRRWQRYFEAERLRYRQRIGPYSGDDRDAVLTELLAQGQLDLDDEWASLVPRSRTLTTGPEQANQ